MQESQDPAGKQKKIHVFWWDASPYFSLQARIFGLVNERPVIEQFSQNINNTKCCGLDWTTNSTY